jgi:hypothetical protein
MESETGDMLNFPPADEPEDGEEDSDAVCDFDFGDSTEMSSDIDASDAASVRGAREFPH